jgi:predicted dehydrogenase
MDKNQITRRAFLAASTTTAVMAGCASNPKPNTAKVVPGKVSPNQQVNVAAIGGGGKGLDDIMNSKKAGANIVAIADPDWKRAAEGFYRCKDAKQYKDYRVMLDEMGKDIDACTVSTPDHTHAPAAYRAMKMGKHVYVQKPLTHTIAEARLLQKTAQETGVITQMGNQGHCGVGVRNLCEMVWSGAIGDVKEAHIWTNRPVWPQGIAEALPEEPVPADMDWDLWIGAAPVRAYNSKYAPFNWRGWWDFGCGAIGDMACHIMDAAFWSLNLIEAESFTAQAIVSEGMSDQTAPLKSSIKMEFPARGKMNPVTVYWHDGGILPPRPADIPADQKIGDGNNGSLFIGTKGYLTAGEYGGDPRLLPDSKMADFKKPAETIKRVSHNSPYYDWIECIQNGGKTASNFDYAAPLTVVANFGNVALHAKGEVVAYDVKNGKVTNNPKLNALLTKQYRKGFELPV